MNPQVHTVAGRLSLRPPQRQSLEVLDRICDLIPPGAERPIGDALAAVQAEFPRVTDFEREFPSFCFALATGVGKTRLMGAQIAYLHAAHGIKNFFVLAPNLTIYNKLIADFTPNTAKYVFKGLAEFATRPPEIITGDNYDQRTRSWLDLSADCHINIFNISKINTEVRGGNSPRIKRLSEYLGESYFSYLAGLPDLVLLMDESHRYRASAGARAINELKPILGLEFTATPFIEGPGGRAIPFKNVIVDYPLASAIADGFVKDPAVVTRKDFNPANMTPEALEQLKLEDGVRLHEQTKVDLETYARQWGHAIVKPFVLVIARDTTHAAALVQAIESDEFFAGRYKGKVLQVDSSRTGAAEDEMIEKLVRVEDPAEPTEIVVHVNMLKEGWDVTNLYTIVPLRAASARTLIEQSIGRGLRLPYGKRTGIPELDRLSIVAHDKFQEIVDEANKPGSPVRLTEIRLTDDEFDNRRVAVVVQPAIKAELGIDEPAGDENNRAPGATPPTPVFASPAEKAAAGAAFESLMANTKRPDLVPSLGQLGTTNVIESVVRDVQGQFDTGQIALPDNARPADIPAIVIKVADSLKARIISIPQINVVPRGGVVAGFKTFNLDMSGLKLAAPEEALWLQYLQSGKSAVVAFASTGVARDRPADYVVDALVDFPDISYDTQAELLYELAGQVVSHLTSYLSDVDAEKVLRFHQGQIGAFVHAQMQPHYFEEEQGEPELVVTRGFSEIKPSNFTVAAGESMRAVNLPVPDKSKIGGYVFGPFKRCLYGAQKFQSDPERVMAVMLERDSEKWFRPVQGQFQIYYKAGPEQGTYQPDFVAETSGAVHMLEVKARSELGTAVVLAKKAAAEKWCELATAYNAQHGEKPWRYSLIPDDVIKENMTLDGLVATSV